MKKVIFAVMVMFAVALTSCTSGTSDCEVSGCDSTYVDSCVVTVCDTTGSIVVNDSTATDSIK